MKKTVFITIGEAPRNDIADSFDFFFKDNPQVSQDGVLNGLSVAEAEEQLAPKGNEEIVVSTFCNGQGIQMSKRKVETKLQQKIEQLENQGVEVIVIFCTAEFHNLKTKKAVLVEPERILLPYIQQKFADQKLGVILPLADQLVPAKQKWQTNQLNPVFTDASPYDFSEEQFTKAGELLKEAKVDTIILDCMGYSRYMREFINKVTQLPVFQSNELLFEYVKDTFVK